MTQSEEFVNRAVAMAVKATVEMTQNVTDGVAFGHKVGRRIRGTFGAELRYLADTNPDMTAESLFWHVIAPKEFPWLTVDNPVAEALMASGARDRARHAHPNPPQDWPSGPMSDDPAWSEGLAAAKASIGEIEPPKPYVPDHVPNPEFAARIEALRALVSPAKRKAVT